MTDPRKYLLRMIFFIFLVFIISFLLRDKLISSFNGNAIINGVILSVLIIGIIFLGRQIIKLVPEKLWIQAIQANGSSSIKPVLLAPLALMLRREKPIKSISMSAAALRSILDGVAGRLDENREISRYLIGLLIFLGLLGTFWGLLDTVSAVTKVIKGLNFSNEQNISFVFSNLQSGLEAPLGGMATAFSSSLFGLAGSLILGFVDLQLGQASGRFYQELEEWLSSNVRITSVNDSFNENPNLSSEHNNLITNSAANHLSELANALTSIEADRSRLLNEITDLNSQLRRLSDNFDYFEKVNQKRIPDIEANIKSLTEESRNHNASQEDLIKQEIRTLGNLIGNKDKNSNRKTPELRSDK